jgi:hypothetical protein
MIVKLQGRARCVKSVYFRTIRSHLPPWSVAAGGILGGGRSCPVERPCCCVDARCSRRRIHAHWKAPLPASMKVPLPWSFRHELRTKASFDGAGLGSHRRRTKYHVQHITRHNHRESHSLDICIGLEAMSTRVSFRTIFSTHERCNTKAASYWKVGRAWRSSLVLRRWHLSGTDECQCRKRIATLW